MSYMGHGTAAKPDAPTEAELRQYVNVPTAVAARYLGTSTATLCQALRGQYCPFGYGVEGKTGQYTYIIPPERLIGWKTGVMPIWDYREVLRYLKIDIEAELDRKLKKLEAVSKTLAALRDA